MTSNIYFDGPLSALEGMDFEIVYADPPWSYIDTANAGRRGAEHKYPVMSVEDICTLPVAAIAAKNSLLFLWATMPQLPNAFAVIDAWGFTYKTCAFTWVKTNLQDPHSYKWGMGRWTRSNAELCLLGTRGKPQRISAGVHSVIASPAMSHSTKPPETRDRILKLVGELPRVELFARGHQDDGWNRWGNEA